MVSFSDEESETGKYTEERDAMEKQMQTISDKISRMLNMSDKYLDDPMMRDLTKGDSMLLVYIPYFYKEGVKRVRGY